MEKESIQTLKREKISRLETENRLLFHKLQHSDLHYNENNKDLFILKEKISKEERSTYLFLPEKRKIYQVEKNIYILRTKRILDVVFSATVIVGVLSWLYPVLFILIKAESRGPVLFKQKRNGLNEKPFECLKFRSMCLNNHSDSLPTIKGDCRVTRVGRFIRKYSIDEIPQFINVLKGDMTIVGPRPHMISETEIFKQKLEDFYIRHQVKPGITGLAQVNGYRGEIKTISDLKNRLRYDLVYIERASLLHDTRIILSTMKKMFFGDQKAF